MTLRLYPNAKEIVPHPIPHESPGEGQHPEKMQGHWLLARAGKRVLRPGGLELTRQMLDVLSIGLLDRVVEFAPGLGVTARIVLRKRPAWYCGVEREPAAVEHLRQQFSGASARIVLGRAEESGLPDGSASVVFGEAMLSMQNARQKQQIVGEANRLLMEGGRYGIHELCFLPDHISDQVRHKIQAAMSKEIHVGVQLLCRSEWIRLLEQNGLKAIWCGEAPMHLLEPLRLLKDEGIVGSLRIAFHMATKPELGSRIFEMRRLFAKYGEHLGAISLVAEKSSGNASGMQNEILCPT